MRSSNNIKKILTISVAAYNVEEYLDNCLASLCVNTEILNSIEVIVVDDGATDNSYKIALKYADMYPDSFIAVHKSNGGYGSTINYSIEHAKGKYFKTLDGDDWLDSEQFENFIKMLLKCNEDVIFSDVRHCYRKRSFVDKVSDTANVDSIDGLSSIKLLEIWGITFKTELLRRSGIQLPNHCLYTDNILDTIPIANARTFGVFEGALYCYRHDRPGQSISVRQRIKKIDDLYEVVKLLVRFYEEEKEKNSLNLGWTLERTVLTYKYLFWTSILLPGKQSRKKIVDYEKTIQNMSPDVFIKLEELGTRGFLAKVIRNLDYKFLFLFKFYYLVALVIRPILLSIEKET